MPDKRDAAVLQHIGRLASLSDTATFCSTSTQVSPSRLRSRMVLQHVLHDGRRQAERRLVEHHQLRRAHQAAADREHLLLAAGERAGRLPAALGQHRKQRKHPFEIARALRARARQHRAHVEVFRDRERRKNLAAFGDLADAEIADRDGSASRRYRCRG